MVKFALGIVIGWFAAVEWARFDRYFTVDEQNARTVRWV